MKIFIGIVIGLFFGFMIGMMVSESIWSGVTQISQDTTSRCVEILKGYQQELEQCNNLNSVKLCKEILKEQDILHRLLIDDCLDDCRNSLMECYKK